jgi:hypothetical protein
MEKMLFFQNSLVRKSSNAAACSRCPGERTVIQQLGGQIFLGTNLPNGHNMNQITTITKWPQYEPNYHNNNQIINGCQIFQMGIKYTNIFPSKAL